MRASRCRPADVVVDARHAAMPDENASTFHTSNPAVDAVWNLARHSALYDTQEQVLDTPTREKGAFMNPLGDSRASMFAFGERAITFEALRDFARSQARYWPDGRVNVVYPNGDGGRDIPDSTEGFVEWVWRVYMTTGDRDQLASLYPVVRNISAYVARAIDPRTGLVTNLPGGGGDYLGGIVDWPPNMRYGYDVGTAARTTENVLAVDVFRRVAQMAAALGRPERRDRAISRRSPIASPRDPATRLTRPDGVLVDGLEANGTPSTHASQLANAFALEYGLVPPPTGDARRRLRRRARESRSESPTFEDLAVRAARGRARRRARHLAHRPEPTRLRADPRRGRDLHLGSWDARQTGDSESHGFGAAVLPAAAGRHPRRHDRRARRRAGRHTHSGPHDDGPRVSWQRNAARSRFRGRAARGRFALDVTIPANMTAAVYVPAPRRQSRPREWTRASAAVPGSWVHGSSRGVVVVTIGSGHYEFQVG